MTEPAQREVPCQAAAGIIRRMRRHIIAAIGLLLLAGAPTPLRAEPKDDAIAAAKKLLDSDNYSWTTTAEGGAGGQAGSTGADGKAQRDGLVMLDLQLRDTMAHIFLQGDKGAFKTDDGQWKSLAEASDERGPERRIANIAKGYRPPAAQARRLAERAQDMKLTDDGALTGALPPEVAQTLVERRVARAGAGAIDIKDAGATVKFWIDKGILNKFQYHVTGTISVAGQEREFDRKTTIEFKDVGTTTIDVPDDARAKMR
jgi:hypothetical protein